VTREKIAALLSFSFGWYVTRIWLVRDPRYVTRGRSCIR
jgi:hypothetical protein